MKKEPPYLPREDTSGNGTEFSHNPVLLEEVMDGLNLVPGGFYVDCTAGGGGHTGEILRRISPDGRVLALDRDPAALEAVAGRLKEYRERLIPERANFVELPVVLDRLGIDEVNGVLFDLGVSSYQLDNPGRGFSYMENAPLDMRMDPDQVETAAGLVNSAGKRELTEIIKRYGEEKWASRIAEFIVRERETRPVETTAQLVEIIKAAIPARARRQGPHPAKRTFQALRIAVNGELDILEEALRGAIDVLGQGGRICVISFHSLEDRTVKETFRELADPCTCPADFPTCVCGQKPILRMVNRRPTVPSARELRENPRSRSAKLRVAEKLGLTSKTAGR